ncbi:MAG: hypothetical protein ACP5O2_05225 [Bacteroidales bacterium]
MITPDIKINKNLSQSTLKRLYQYGLLAEKGLKNGEVLTSFEKLARQTGEDLQTVISDIAEAGLQVIHGNILQNEHLLQVLNNYLPQDNQEKVIVAGSAERIQKMLENYEFAGYSFNIKGVVLTSGQISEITTPGLNFLKKNEAEKIINQENITTAVLCTDFAHSRSTAGWLIDAGIRKIWNLSPVSLPVPPEITVENVIPGYPKWRRKYSLS